MNLKLRDVASVRCGLVLSRKKARELKGVAYPLLNFRALKDFGYIERAELDLYNAEDILPSEYLTHEGDIVVRLTAPYTAVLIDEETEGIVISSNFITIRVKDDTVLPEYLFWWLNTSRMKRSLYENATSNMLGAVKASEFAEREWKAVPIEDQRLIADMNLLARREVILLDKLAIEKEKYYAAVIQQYQKTRKRGNV